MSTFLAIIITPATFDYCSIKTNISYDGGMKYLISTAYIYPVCPISFSHARIYVIADIYARYEQMKGNDIYFPIATHYSGNTAHKIASTIVSLSAKNESLTISDDSTVKLFRDTYKLQPEIIATFTEPMAILNHYNVETLKELRALDINADYSNQYTTDDADFDLFVKVIIEKYEQHDVLKLNTKKELSLDYENPQWREAATQLIKRTVFVERKQQNVPLASLKNIRSDWNLLRDSGYGAKYHNRIVDPMFDSELFSIFDLFVKFRNMPNAKHVDTYTFFHNLFDKLLSGEPPVDELEKAITEWLPCNHFIVEEHLRNWIAKKMHTESILLCPKYQTEKYTIIGMGLLNGRRMSASRGSSIFTKDLLDKYGGLMTRLLMILQGGNISMDFNYDPRMEQSIQKMIRRFRKHTAALRSYSCQSTDKMPDFIANIENEVIDSINNGKLRKALLILIDRCPRNIIDCSANDAYWLTIIYNWYIGRVFAPVLMSEEE